jgi:hypothetical protein
MVAQNHKQQTHIKYELALLFIDSQDYSKAEQYLQATLAIWKANSESKAHKIAQCNFKLAVIYCHTGRWKACLDILEANLIVRRALSPSVKVEITALTLEILRADDVQPAICNRARSLTVQVGSWKDVLEAHRLLLGKVEVSRAA